MWQYRTLLIFYIYIAFRYPPSAIYKFIKSYIKNTKDFLQKLPENIIESSILVSFDVVNLYPNIPHDLRLEAIKFWLDKYPDELSSRISKDFVLQSIKFIWGTVAFALFFLQTKGTAMGTKFAPILHI